MFCWYPNPPGYLPRAIIGISAGCLLIVATLIMLADASGITLTLKSQKLINQPIKDPKGLLLKIIELVWKLGLIRVALLVYPPPTRPLGPLPDPYPIPRGYLIPTGQKIK